MKMKMKMKVKVKVKVKKITQLNEIVKTKKSQKKSHRTSRT